jgi:AraC family transcriptional regulator
MSQYAQPADPRGIEQFGMVASAPGLAYCISGAPPYSLDFAHSLDMICLVLGDIVSQTKKAGTSQTKAHERMPVGAQTDRPAT